MPYSFQQNGGRKLNVATTDFLHIFKIHEKQLYDFQV
jgi:hypothetical protein